MATDRDTTGTARGSPPLPATSVGASSAADELYSRPEEHMLDPAGPLSTRAATADNIVALLRAYRDSWNLHRFGPFDDNPAQVVECPLPWTEMQKLDHRLDLDLPGITTPINGDRDLGRFVTQWVRWEYTVDQRFRMRMAPKTVLHHELQNLVTRLVHERVTAAADRLRAKRSLVPPLPPLFPPRTGTEVICRHCPVSPGSEDLHDGYYVVDGSIYWANDGTNHPFLVEIGFGQPRKDEDCIAILHYGEVSAVLAVDIEFKSQAERRRISDPASIPVTVRLFRPVEVDQPSDSDSDNDDISSNPSTIMFRAERVTYHKATPSTARTGRQQVGICLSDVYPQLAGDPDLSTEAIDLTFRDIWDCVVQAWPRQVLLDSGTTPKRLTADGKKRKFIVSSGPKPEDKRDDDQEEDQEEETPEETLEED